MSVTVYRFRVTVSDNKQIHREIRIQAEQNFKDLHHTMMKAFHLTNVSGTTLYTANNRFKKEDKLALAKAPSDSTTVTMDEVQVGKMIDKGKKFFVYETKTTKPWSFNIEMVNTENDVDLDDEGRFPKWYDTSGIPLPDKKVFKPTPVEDDDDDEFEEDDSFGKGFDDLKVEDAEEEETEEGIPVKKRSQMEDSGDDEENEENDEDEF